MVKKSKNRTNVRPRGELDYWEMFTAKLSRRGYAIRIIPAYIVNLSLVIWSMIDASVDSTLVMNIFMLINVFIVVLQIRRLRDQGRPEWYVIINLVPILNLWLAITLLVDEHGGRV